MSYADMQIEKGDDKYLTIKAGESVQFNILSKEPKKSISHWVNKKKIGCLGKTCEHCEEGDVPKQSWKIQVKDRKSNSVKEFEFGAQVAEQIKTIAEILKESNQTVHDVDLRIKRSGSGLDTSYFVNQVKKAEVSTEPEPAGDDDVPF